MGGEDSEVKSRVLGAYPAMGRDGGGGVVLLGEGTGGGSGGGEGGEGGTGEGGETEGDDSVVDNGSGTCDDGSDTCDGGSGTCDGGSGGGGVGPVSMETPVSSKKDTRRLAGLFLSDDDV